MRRILPFLTILLLAIQTRPLQAQTIPVNPKFGDVSDAEVDLKVYDRDSSAAAVLLYRSYFVRIGISANAQLTRTVRIHDRWKILKESGKDAADYEIVYATNYEDREQVSGIKATTYNRRPDGKIEQIKMSRGSQFNEKYADNRNKISFAPEGIREGSVVEVAFEIQSPVITIPDIYLQLSDYPVNKIDVEVTYADFFQYNRVTKGYLTADFKQDINNETITTPYTGLMNFTMYHDYFSAKDIPAMKAEPYCYNTDQYKLSVAYNLRQVTIPGVLTQSYHVNWENVDARIAESSLMKQVRQHFRDADALRERIAGEADATGQILAVWTYILDRVDWNKEIRLLPQDNNQTLKKGTGSSADINALMASALNSLGFRAGPVLVKPRSDGALLDYYISSSEFASFILRILAPDGSVHYLDAARKDSYLDVISPDYLVTRARLVHLEGIGEWIDLTRLPVTNTLAQIVTITPQPEHEILQGSSEINATNQCSYDIKAHYRRFDNPEQWIEDAENDQQIEILSMELKEPDKQGNSAQVSYSFQQRLDKSGDFLYIRPFLSNWHDPQDFRDEHRKLPVDFPYRQRINYMCTINIPEGYAVEQLPVTTRGNNPAVGTFLIQCGQTGNVIQLSFRMDLNTLSVQEKDYPDFRDFWEHLGKTENSVIVLKKL